MSNDKSDATYHPDATPDEIEEAAMWNEDPDLGAKWREKHHQHMTPEDAPVPHAHMDEH